MKWTNPGHQMDELGTRLMKVKNLYLYGVDDRAKKAYDFLQWLGVSKEFNISFVLDITVLNQEGSVREFCKKRVIPFQTELCSEIRTAPEESLVALPFISQTAEREILNRLGFENIYYLSVSHNRRDNFIQNFVCVWLMYRYHKLAMHTTDYILTSKCNLNCKYCLNFTEYIKNPYEMSFEDFKSSIDALFRKVDYLYSFHLCGGEPLLARDTLKCVQYLEKYRDRIFEFFIITNGTILPSEEVVSAVKALEGTFLIDDYSNTVPNMRIGKIKDRLESHGVGYSLISADHWYDVDVMNTDNSGISEEALERWRDGCNTYLYTLGEKRLYACCYAKYAERAGLNTLAPEDYIAVDDTPKMEILEFIQGYMRKGYTSLCTHCLGIGEHSKQVMPAIQIPRKEGGETEKSSATKGPLVSICVPVYNTGKYLARCIQSLIGQSYNNLEIILVDDGSTDNSGLICDEFAALDARISVFHKANGGEASARNFGLSAAAGKYVMFIDSDDEYFPDAVQRLVDAASQENTDLVIGGYLERRGDVERFATGHRRRYRAAELAHVYLTSKCPFDLPYIATTVNAKLFRVKSIRDHHISFDERFVIGNDAVFICDYLKYAETVCDIFSPIYVYYKFDPAERLQGMGWYYPDTVFLFAYVADRMLKLMPADTAEAKQIITKQYQDFLYGLMSACVNQERFEDGLLPYFAHFCKIDLVQTGAQMDLNEHSIKTVDGGIPTRILSFLIVNRRYKELGDLLRELGKARGIIPYHGEWSRQMIQIGDEGTSDFAGTDEELPTNCAAEDMVLLEQIDELIQNIVLGQREVEASKARAGEADARANEAETRAGAAEARANEAETRAGEAEARANEAGTRAGEAEARANEAEMRAGEAEARANEAETRAGEAAARANEAETRAGEATIRANEAEIRASEAETQLHFARAELDLTKAQLDEITHSTSWRYTEPLRAVMRFFRNK